MRRPSHAIEPLLKGTALRIDANGPRRFRPGARATRAGIAAPRIRLTRIPGRARSHRFPPPPPVVGMGARPHRGAVRASRKGWVG
jgi:hypothetical protein